MLYPTEGAGILGVTEPWIRGAVRGEGSVSRMAGDKTVHQIATRPRCLRTPQVGGSERWTSRPRYRYPTSGVHLTQTTSPSNKHGPLEATSSLTFLQYFGHLVASILFL